MMTMKSALITGAASGIGKACAERMAQEGYGVVVADVNLPAAEELAAKLAAEGLSAIAVHMDVADEQEVEAGFDKMMETYGSCDLVMSNAGPAKWSYEQSTSEYEFGGCTEIACLAGGLGQNFINIMFTQKFVNATGYKTFEEVVANKYPVKMVIKKNGSFGEQTAEKVCEALGITFDDIESWGGKVEKTGGDAIKSGLQDDLYDMTIDHIGKGQSNTTELCLTHDMYDVELNEDTRNKLCEMGYTPVTVEAGTWNKQDTDIETVGSQQCLIVDANMDAAVAYTLTKAICENKEALVTAVASLEYFDPTIAGGSGYTGCPLHPGAKAYYEEMGYDCD